MLRSERQVEGAPNSRRHQVVGSALVCLGSLQLAGAVVLGKVASRLGLSVPQVLSIRFTLAALLLVPIVSRIGSQLRVPARVDWILVLLGVVLGMASAFMFAALQHGSVAAVSLLVFTYPAWLTLLTMVTGNAPPRWIILGAMAITLGGAALVAASAGGVDIDPIGIVLALGSAVGAAFYFLGAAAVVKQTNSLAGSVFVNAGAGLSLGVVAIVYSSGVWPTSPAHWGVLIAMGALTSGGIACLFAGVRRLGAVRTAIIATSEPLASSLLAFLFLEEAIQVGTAIGGLLILIGAVIASLSHGPSPTNHLVS